MKRCPSCGSTDLRDPYTTKPPAKHDGPCTESCKVVGTLCLNCRMFRPKPKER